MEKALNKKKLYKSGKRKWPYNARKCQKWPFSKNSYTTQEPIQLSTTSNNDQNQLKNQLSSNRIYHLIYMMLSSSFLLWFGIFGMFALLIICIRKINKIWTKIPTCKLLQIMQLNRLRTCMKNLELL